MSIGTMASAEDDRDTSAGRKCYVPARYVYVVISMVGSVFVLILRASLPIALTGMVRNNSSADADDSLNETDTCPSWNAVHESSARVTGEFDWDEVTQSYILNGGGYGMLASTLIGARVAELWSTKYMYAICCFLSTAVFLVLPFIASWSVDVLIVTQVFGGLFLGPMMPISSALSSSWFPAQERQKLSGLAMSAMSLGSIVCNLVTGTIVDSLGWRAVFYIYSTVVISFLLVWMFVVYDTPDQHPRISEEERNYINAGTKKDQSQAAVRLPWKDILLSPPVWAHIAMSLPPEWLTMTLVNSLPTYMTHILHFSTSQAGYLCAIPQVAAWTSFVTFGFLSQWIRRKQYVSHIRTYYIFNGIATLGTSALVLCLPLVRCNSAATITILSLATATSGAYIGGSQLNHMDLAVNYAGTLSGWTTTLSTICGILATTVSGRLTNNQQTLSAWNKVFYVAAAVNIVPFFIYLFFGSVDEQPWNRTKQKEADNKDRIEVATVGVDG